MIRRFEIQQINESRSSILVFLCLSTPQQISQPNDIILNFHGRIFSVSSIKVLNEKVCRSQKKVGKCLHTKIISNFCDIVIWNSWHISPAMFIQCAFLWRVMMQTNTQSIFLKFKANTFLSMPVQHASNADRTHQLINSLYEVFHLF